MPPGARLSPIHAIRASRRAAGVAEAALRPAPSGRSGVPIVGLCGSSVLLLDGVSVEVPSDAGNRYGTRPCGPQRSGGALCVRAARPGVVHEQDRNVTVHSADNVEAINAEVPSTSVALYSAQQRAEALRSRTDDVAGQVVERMISAAICARDGVESQRVVCEPVT